MKPHVANTIAAIVLITMGGWAYLTSESPSLTALIPCAFGILFLALNGPLKKENKVVAHVIVVLTLVVFASLFMPLSGTLERGDTLGTVRVGLMMAATLSALIAYVRSFINARRQREG